MVLRKTSNLLVGHREIGVGVEAFTNFLFVRKETYINPLSLVFSRYVGHVTTIFLHQYLVRCRHNERYSISTELMIICIKTARNFFVPYDIKIMTNTLLRNDSSSYSIV